jgi:hypothetical protein
MINNTTISLVHRFLNIESEKRTKPRRFLIGSVWF